MPDERWIIPHWPAPSTVRACTTTRLGGVSQGAYASLNLAVHVGDDPVAVRENRQRITRALGLPQSPRWLTQTHSTNAARADGLTPDACEADASFTRQAGVVCGVLTADCLPVLFCDRAGTTVAAVHAGWRGLLHGVLENSVASMGLPGQELLAWLGPAIGPDAFEVGPEVRTAFVAHDPGAAAAFRPGVAERWYADIFALARLRLAQLGVTGVYGGGLCTYHDAQRFYSYRREQVTGRMASLIWLG